MSVINIHSGASYDTYIGRAGRGEDGYFGNPIRLGVKCPLCDKKHTHDDFQQCYKRWLWHKINTDQEFKLRLKSQIGKTLGCFCKPKPCHGDIMVLAIQYLNKDEE